MSNKDNYIKIAHLKAKEIMEILTICIDILQSINILHQLRFIYAFIEHLLKALVPGTFQTSG